MYEFVEPHLRRLVAEHLGVGLEDLVSEVSLRDDLAADSLDLVELAMALEREFAIEMPERILDEVRTYSDLVHVTGLLIRARCEATARGAEPQPRIWVRIVSATGASAGTLERAGWLTPYIAETIAEDAVRAGNGARLEVTVATSMTAGVAWVEHQFAPLRERGIRVTVRQGDRAAALPVHPTPDRVAEPHQVATAGAHSPLVIQAFARVAGKDTVGQVTSGSATMDVRFLPPTPASEVEGVAGS